MSDSFALPGGFARDFGVQELNGQPIDPDTWIYPACACVPMGFSWSVFLAQSVAIQKVISISGFTEDKALQEDNPDRLLGDDIRFFAYIDNIGVIGKSRVRVREQMQLLREALEAVGLATHDFADADHVQKVLGITLDGKRLRTRASPERYCRIRHLLRWLLRQKQVSGKMLEQVMGHLTYVSLVRRPLLSYFHTVYKYIRAQYQNETSRLWASCRAELAAF